MTALRRRRARGKETAMIEKTGWPAPIALFRRRIAWAAALYRSARTTFEVVRLLDRETHFVSAPTRTRPFVARTGYIV
jgi:hypothetical protein